MAKSKIYGFLLDEYENAALDFLVNLYQEYIDEESRTNDYSAFKCSRSGVVGALISIKLREIAEANSTTPKDLIGICREWEK